MNKILLTPLKGVEIFLDDVNIINITLGSSKEEVIKLLGNPISITKGNYYPEDTYYFYNNSLQLTFYKGSILSYIEIFYDLSDSIFIDNLNIFSNEVEKILEYFTGRKKSFKEEYNGTSYVFQDLSLSLGRPCRPEDIEEDLGENDYQKGIKFSTVGIGVKGYFNDDV